jgi:hypothetical protein
MHCLRASFRYVASSSAQYRVRADEPTRIFSRMASAAPVPPPGRVRRLFATSVTTHNSLVDPRIRVPSQQIPSFTSFSLGQRRLKQPTFNVRAAAGFRSPSRD